MVCWLKEWCVSFLETGMQLSSVEELRAVTTGQKEASEAVEPRTAQEQLAVVYCALVCTLGGKHRNSC